MEKRRKRSDEEVFGNYTQIHVGPLRISSKSSCDTVSIVALTNWYSLVSSTPPFYLQ